MRLIRKLRTFLRRPAVGAARDGMLREVALRCDGIAGKVVLDVGCDRAGALVKRMASHHGAKKAIGLNLSAEDRRLGPRCRLMKADARDTGLGDDAIDLIVSFSAFEHIHDFPRALVEMHRILRPGGLLYAHFGPIWSAPYGHHLWADGYTYWNLVLPPWCHLLMTPAELDRHLADEHGLAEAERALVAGYVFDASDEYGFSQNKLMYEDYERIVADSPFETLVFKGYDDPELAERYAAPRAVVESLNARYPGYRNFHYAGIFTLLAK